MTKPTAKRDYTPAPPPSRVGLAALLPALIQTLKAELADPNGNDRRITLTLDRTIAADLVRILEFAQAVKIETMKGEHP